MCCSRSESHWANSEDVGISPSDRAFEILVRAADETDSLNPVRLNPTSLPSASRNALPCLPYPAMGAWRNPVAKVT